MYLYIKYLHLILKKHTNFIDSNIDSPSVDFFLYSQCKHAIMANSTFSWWATWLMSNEKKKIISPYYYRKGVVFDHLVMPYHIRIK